MKAMLATIPVLLVLVFTACAPQANAPADIEAISNLMAEFEKAENSKDVEWLSSTFFADDAINLPPNRMPIVGKNAIHDSMKKSFDSFTAIQETVAVDQALSSDDLAVARGTYTWAATPVAVGLPSIDERGKWSGTFLRQPDGSWKCRYLIWNSDLPALGATESGAEEEALYQIERDWLNASLQKDMDALGRILADGFVSNFEGQIRNKRQLLADVKSSTAKIESAELSNMKAAVFGDTASVSGVYTEKSTTGGKDSSGQYHFTETFVKRGQTWECTNQFITKVQ